MLDFNNTIPIPTTWILLLFCSELSSGIYCRVKWLSTDVSEVRTASIIRDEWSLKSVDNQFTRQYIPEDNSEHHTRRRENLKSHIVHFRLAKCSYASIVSTDFNLVVPDILHPPCLSVSIYLYWPLPFVTILVWRLCYALRAVVILRNLSLAFQLGPNWAPTLVTPDATGTLKTRLHDQGDLWTMWMSLGEQAVCKETYLTSGLFSKRVGVLRQKRDMLPRQW
jgi:hypothetical protein